LEKLARALDDDRLQAEIGTLAERVTEGRFFVACIGQFKRGKSTLLNALVGRPLVPVGVLPVTTIPTVLRYGPVPAARVRVGGEWREIEIAQLVSYVSEEHNPGNAAGVEAAEVFAPSAILRDGLCLVDTPGVGSVFTANTAAVRDFVPQIDAALVVIGADPPISGEELELIAAVGEHAADIVVVLNKADRVSDADAQIAGAFTERVLAERLGRPVGTVFRASATERIAGSGPSRDWDALVAALRALVDRSGRTLVQHALERGVVRLAGECLRQIDEARDALVRPLDESERRVDALRRCVAEVAHRSLQLSHLWEAEQEALGRTFARRREEFLDRARPVALVELDGALEVESSRWGPVVRRRALAAARDVARRHLEPWLAEEQEAAEAAYRETASRFVTVGNEFLERLARSGEIPVENLPRALPLEAGFRTGSRFYFHELPALAQGTPIVDWWLDRLRPPGRTRRGVRLAARTYLTQLLEMNATRVANDLDERVLESRRRLQAELSALLESVFASADRALTRARAAHAAGADAVRGAVARMLVLRREALALQTPE
jgi:GTP-binding protein EngB required for normal cell division